MTKVEEARRIEDLVRRLENIPDPDSRQTAQALMEAILELHGAGLDRILEIVFDSGETGKAMIRRFASDGLVASLLVLHGLHPDDVETRIQQALARVHVNAELIGVFEDTVRVRLPGGDTGHCGLKESVEAVIREAAPDAGEIVIEEGISSNGFVLLAALGMAVPDRA